MKKPLQKNRGCLGIGLLAPVWHQGRSVALIEERYGYPKPTVQLAGETLAVDGKGVGCPIRIDRQAHQ
jgi:hypothetical protein